MGENLQTQPDWFDRLWEANEERLPVYLRNTTIKNFARTMLGAFIDGAAGFAKTPEGVRQVVAYARIAAILKGASGVMGQPDPSPEEVADMVERLVQKVKP